MILASSNFVRVARLCPFSSPVSVYVCVFVVSPFFSHEEGAAQFWNNKPWRIWVCTGLEQEAMAAKVEDDGVVFFLLIDFQQLKNLCGGVNLLSLRENPKEALLCMGAAVHLAKCSCYGSDEGCRSVDKVNIRLYNQTETIIALKNFKVAILVRI
uniref:Uncharacterized protein n=1 Tax=Aegilops tauschii subsp. strangulata TaxID=200361 RepID=A0A453JR07_AEGTS